MIMYTYLRQLLPILVGNMDAIIQVYKAKIVMSVCNLALNISTCIQLPQ